MRKVLVGTLVALALAGGCAAKREAPGVTNGKESLYSFLSTGNLKRANLALRDTWDLGPRSAPVHIAPITWTEDPYQDKYWRFMFYSLRFTSNLLVAYYEKGDSRYKDKLLEVLRSYLAADLGRPVTWPGALAKDRHPFDDRHTAAFRALVLVNTYGKLKRSGDLPADLDAALVQDLTSLGGFLADERNFEDGQNHGFNEAAGLLSIAANFPGMPDAGAWLSLGRQRLETLMRTTVDSDGVEVENSPFYHFYVLAFALEDQKWATSYMTTLGSDFSHRLDAMFAYATQIPQPDGKLPLQGATVTYDVRSVDPDVFGDDDSPAIEGEAPNEAFAFVRSGGHEGAPLKEQVVLFAESGQAVLRSRFATADEYAASTHIAMNAGAWRNKHCHLDTLALTYFGAGRPLLVDSGLYSYERTDRDSYLYFFGTRGHSTVAVDGNDQYPGAAVVDVTTDEVRTYRDLAKVRVKAGLTKSLGDWAYQSAEHTLYDGVTHGRAVVLLRQDLALVLDSLKSASSHEYTQMWHFAPTLKVSVDGLRAVATDASGGAPLFTVTQADAGAALSLSLASGATGPMQGWSSERYGVKVPNPALLVRSKAENVRFATLLASGRFAATPAVVRAKWEDGRIHATVCAGDRSFVVDVTHPHDAGEDVLVTEAPGCP